MDAHVNNKLSILIYGAGSIGVYLGAILQKAGHDVTLFGRRKLERLHESILINGVLYKTPERIYTLKEDTRYDVVFVTTKLYNSEHALKELHNKNITSDILVLIQNGLVDKKLFEDFRAHPGFVTVSVFEGYHLIENQLLTTKSDIGWQTENSEPGKKLQKLLELAGIACMCAHNLDSVRAEKMILVNAVGALSALEKKTLGELITDKKIKKIVEALIDESYEVLNKAYGLPNSTEVKNRFYETISQVKNHYSSMYQDVLSGRQTEIEYLNGYIVRLGKEQGIPTPVNEEIYKKLIELSESK